MAPQGFYALNPCNETTLLCELVHAYNPLHKSFKRNTKEKGTSPLEAVNESQIKYSVSGTVVPSSAQAHLIRSGSSLLSTPSAVSKWLPQKPSAFMSDKLAYL